MSHLTAILTIFNKLSRFILKVSNKSDKYFARVFFRVLSISSIFDIDFSIFVKILVRFKSNKGSFVNVDFAIINKKLL